MRAGSVGDVVAGALVSSQQNKPRSAAVFNACCSDMKIKIPTPLPTLLKGQLWKTRKAHVEIMEVGKLLAHYRLFAPKGQKRVPTTMERVRVIQDYLAAEGGK